MKLTSDQETDAIGISFCLGAQHVLDSIRGELIRKMFKIWEEIAILIQVILPILYDPYITYLCYALNNLICFKILNLNSSLVVWF